MFRAGILSRLGTLAISAVWLWSILGVAVAAPVNVDGSGLAVQGYDPVAYFIEERAVPGNSEITAGFDGATYRFVSPENRETFLASPEKYVPAYGGYCAFGMAHGYTASIEPDKFTIFDGRLYLNYNQAVQNSWRADIAGFNDRADAEWSKLADN